MRSKKLLATVLLSVGLCFVPALGHGEIKGWSYKDKTSCVDSRLLVLEARVNYIMRNPTSFLEVDFDYDPFGSYGRIMLELPENVDTKNKVCVRIRDSRGVFSYKSGVTLLDQFKKRLENVYSYIKESATDMNADIVAIFYSEGDLPLGYFYQGEYYLWER